MNDESPTAKTDAWQAITPADSAPPYAVTPAWVIDALGVAPERGLSAGLVRERQRRFGSNRIGTAHVVSRWRILRNQFRGAVVWLLIVAAVLSLWMGDLVEAGAILVVLLVNALIGYVNEVGAEQSMAALRKLARTRARVRREGREAEIDAAELVPGDVVLLEAGDMVPADLRLVETVDLQADESALTGESAPVEKSTAPVAASAVLGDRVNMAFRGTAITRGSGTGVVVAIGRQTQIGEIADLVAGAEAESTPLERRLDRLGRRLALGTFAVAALVAAIGAAGGRGLYEMIETGIALAVAAVPEGLPIVATLALARGMWRMAERNVLVNRLSAVETLGSTTVLLTDKTGTLTQNRMSVERLVFPDREAVVPAAGGAAPEDPRLEPALRVAALCNDARLGEGGRGDPMEIALLEAARAFGREPEALRAAAPRLREVAFDPETKLMATVHRENGLVFAAVKGAPEAVLDAAERLWTPSGPEPLPPDGKAALSALAGDAAARGLRLLGVGISEGEEAEAHPYAGLAFLGFVGLVDPPRADVPGAIAECHDAGLRVVMVTGDHAATARKIAADVGLTREPDAAVCGAEDVEAARAGDGPARERLLACDVFARIPPRAKLDLAALHQSEGAVVAMTGDGVNDAPALKKADIGVAMGRRGTQVAAEASDIILRDDAFPSIVHAVRQGRVIYGNIRTFIRYLFSCNLSEIVVIGAALLAGLPLPLLPLQILFLNLVTDVFPALAIGFGEGARDVMRQRPRPRDAPLLGRSGWLEVAGNGMLISLAVMAVFLHTLGTRTEGEANAAAFATLCLAQLWFAFALHPRAERLWSSEMTRNRRLWGAIALSAGLMLLGFYLPPLAEVLELTPPDAALWTAILGASLAPLAAREALGALGARRAAARS
jgi:Ca2+-transporting ATPase